MAVEDMHLLCHIRFSEEIFFCEWGGGKASQSVGPARGLFSADFVGPFVARRAWATGATPWVCG
jgi:hypothetical protein